MEGATYTVAEVVAGLRAELARHGHSQTWLAAEVGESKHWVSRRLAGTTDLNVEDVLRICRALDIPLSRVMPDTRVSA